MSQDNQAPVQVDQNPLLKPSKNATKGTDSFILAKLLAECFFFQKQPLQKILRCSEICSSHYLQVELTKICRGCQNLVLVLVFILTNNSTT